MKFLNHLQFNIFSHTIIIMSFMKHGLRRDSHDERDVCLMPLHYEKVDLPKRFSLRDKIKNVFQQ